MSSITKSTAQRHLLTELPVTEAAAYPEFARIPQEQLPTYELFQRLKHLQARSPSQLATSKKKQHAATRQVIYKDHRMSVPEGTEILLIRTGDKTPGKGKQIFDRQFWPRGLVTIVVVYRDGKYGMHEKDDEGIFVEQYDPIFGRSLSERLPDVATHTITLDDYINPAEVSGNLINWFQKQSEESKLTLRELAASIQLNTEVKISESVILNDMKGKTRFIPLERIRIYASYFQYDERVLAILSNRRYNAFTASDWCDGNNILFIESDKDLARLAYYRENDPQHTSLGWRLYAARKDLKNSARTAHHFYSKHFDIKNESSSNALSDDLELHKKIYSEDKVKGIAGILKISVQATMDIFLKTFFLNQKIMAGALKQEPPISSTGYFGFENLYEAINHLFGGLVIYIGQADIASVVDYMNSRNYLGALAFAMRRSHQDLPSIPKWSQIVGLDWRILMSLEKRSEINEAKRAKSWIQLLTFYNLDTEELAPLTDHPLFQLSAGAAMLREIIGDDSLSEVAREHGVRRVTLQSLTAPQFTTISIKKAFTAARLAEDKTAFQRQIIEGYDWFVKIFSEVHLDNPVIHLTQNLLDFVSGFNLADFLLKYRIKRMMTLKAMGQQIGVIGNMVKLYETGGMKPKSEETRKHMIDMIVEDHPELNILEAGRVLYLSLHPQLIEVFPVKDTYTDQFMTLEDADSFVQKLSSLAYLRGRDGYEKKHYGELKFFLGELAPGQINYSLPKDKTLADFLDVESVVSRLQTKASRLHGSAKNAAKKTGISKLRTATSLKARIQNPTLAIDGAEIQRFATALQENPRDMYLNFKAIELFRGGYLQPATAGMVGVPGIVTAFRPLIMP